MVFDVDIVLRDETTAVTERVVYEGKEAGSWDETDVEAVLKTMLLAIDRLKHPHAGADNRYVALRGFSWIVEPTSGGVVIAIELPLGAVVAGPFDVPQQKLDALVGRVLAAARPVRDVVH